MRFAIIVTLCFFTTFAHSLVRWEVQGTNFSALLFTEGHLDFSDPSGSFGAEALYLYIKDSNHPNDIPAQTLFSDIDGGLSLVFGDTLSSLFPLDNDPVIALVDINARSNLVYEVLGEDQEIEQELSMFNNGLGSRTIAQQYTAVQSCVSSVNNGLDRLDGCLRSERRGGVTSISFARNQEDWRSPHGVEVVEPSHWSLLLMALSGVLLIRRRLS